MYKEGINALDYKKYCWWPPGWPDWANFRLMGECLGTLGSSLKITELYHILDNFFHR
jgi:hypothetical protein